MGDWQEQFLGADKKMSLYEILMILMLSVSLFIILIMYTRIKQLTSELNHIKSMVEVTDEELNKLAKDIEDFKKLKIF